ncbi:3-oxoacyl-[acyl-carrier-protein] synthase III C-terminal domain-containing protein [Nonomuraea sp. NPDC046802]|uniref:3-oxoacyl-ACP synthase III family protein n=1 Tax=Nonomuraea sp. NPDC046802 TaxID=3154919 RepID=UPI0033E43E06
MIERRHARLAAVAVHLPDTLLGTAELEERLAERNPGVRIPRGLIEHTTGVAYRHVAAPGQQASDLAAAAAHDVLAQSGHSASQVDLVMYAGVTVDAVEPATAHLVAAKAGLTCPVFDVRNACNSLLVALELAEALIAAGRYSTILVTCGEIATPAMTWHLPSAAAFEAAIPSYTVSDSGAALLVEAAAEPGIIAHRACADSTGFDAAIVPITRTEDGGYHSGPFTVDFFRLAAAVLRLDPAHISAPLIENGLTWQDLATICVHQASMSSVGTFCNRFGIPADKVEITVAEHGNLVACTLAAQLAQAAKAGRLRRGDLVALVGLASGVSAATMLVRW